MKKTNPNKKWFSTLKEAKQAKEERTTFDPGIGIFKQLSGGHKGQYFVGDFIDFVNRY